MSEEKSVRTLGVKRYVYKENGVDHVFTEASLAEALRVFWKVQGRYMTAKKGIILEIFWILLISLFMFQGENPFPEEIKATVAGYLLIAGLIFWSVCLYGSIRSIVIYKRKYNGDNVEMFMNELKNQPWR